MKPGETIGRPPCRRIDHPPHQQPIDDPDPAPNLPEFGRVGARLFDPGMLAIEWGGPPPATGGDDGGWRAG